MDSNVIWGAILIAYIVPYVIWAISREQTLELRKKFYPGRPQEEVFDNNSTRYGLLWSVGMALLLLAWWVEMQPFGALLFLAVVVSITVGAIWLSRKREVFSTQNFRFWAAGSVVWLLLVGAWFLVFQNDTSLENYQFAMIGAFPPAIGAAAILAFRWAKAGGR